MGVFDSWDEEYLYMDMQPTMFDLSAPNGFDALELRANRDALAALDLDHYDALAGADLAQLAEALTSDFLQQSVSLPRGAFADPQASGRELLLIKRAYRYFIGKALMYHAYTALQQHMAFPSGQQSTPSTQRAARQPQSRTRKP